MVVLAGGRFLKSQVPLYVGFSLTRTPPPPDHHKALYIGLLQGPRGVRFLVSEVPLQSLDTHTGWQTFYDLSDAKAGSWTGSPRGKRAPMVGGSSTAFGR